VTGLAILIGLAAAQVPTAAARNCDDPQNQSEMNLCASSDFERADDELIAFWPRIVETVRRMDLQTGPAGDGRQTGETRLHEAQRAWVGFRDAYCAVVGYQARGGSMEPMLYNGCRARLTRERIEQLRSDLPLDPPR
jgi:uncharacterized protein YecT (DUF1311 family)